MGLAVPTHAVAGPNGTINLAWEFEGGVSVSVEVNDSCWVEMFLLQPGNPRQWVVSQSVAA